jgi:hypothetical protein
MTAYIYINTDSYVRVFNNLLVANAGDTGPNNAWILMDFDANDQLYNNTIIGGTVNGTSNCALLQYGTNFTFENNVLSNCNNLLWTNSASFSALNYNTYQSSSLSWRDGPNFYAGFASWQTAAGAEANSQATTGGLGLNGTYAPNADSIVIGAAANLTSLGITALDSDKIGAARTSSSAWDAGAYTLCTYMLNAGGQAFTAQGGQGTITVTAPTGCPWSVGNLPSWITLASAASSSGDGTVTFQVNSNSGMDTSGSFTVAGYPFNIDQEAASIPGLSFIGSMPHIAAEENWVTTFTVVNKGAVSAAARLSFFGDPNDVSGSGPLTLPLTFPQQAEASGPLLAASLDNTIAANASLTMVTAGPQVPPVEMGSAQLSASGSVDGFAIFHLIPGAQEAVVPMETRNAGSYVLSFDNTNGVVLGVAVANVSMHGGSVGIILRDDSGTEIGTDSMVMPPDGHIAFVVSTQYPVTANIRGTIEFDTPAGGSISVLGIRTTPLGSSNTLTTIPALANVGTTGGSIAHIATGNGWQTTFVLVNTGTSVAQVNLNFFADVTGAALPLPLSFPQSGSGTTMVASSVNQTLPAGATWLVESAAPLSDPAPTTGSAQVTANGNVGGFVIFRYNPNGQEAGVPLESGNASAYILAFDNTAGTATGIAINSVSSQSVNVPVIVRDDTGAQIATDSLNLAANGHLAFTLVSDKYPQTANIRGTIEFDAPAGAQIGALGIRIPIAHTFTTLPALVKP